MGHNTVMVAGTFDGITNPLIDATLRTDGSMGIFNICTKISDNTQVAVVNNGVSEWVTFADYRTLGQSLFEYLNTHFDVSPYESIRFSSYEPSANPPTQWIEV